MNGWQHIDFVEDDFEVVISGPVPRYLLLDDAIKQLRPEWDGFSDWVKALRICGWDVDKNTNVHSERELACNVYNRLSRALAEAGSRGDFFGRL
jgi:hypothetical protein